MKSLEQHKRDVEVIRKYLGEKRFGHPVTPKFPTGIECPKCGNEFSYVENQPHTVGFTGNTKAKFVAHNHIVNVYCPRCDYNTTIELV